MMRRTTRVALVFFLNAMMSASLSLARFDAGGLMGTVSDVEGNTLDEVLPGKELSYHTCRLAQSGNIGKSPSE